MYTAGQFIEGTFLLIDKPIHWTSFDVIGKIRGPLQRYCNTKKLKVGHAGTLDPLATGLLIVVTGKFTKKAEELQTLDKEYTGTITLGGVTPSYDAETEITETFSLENITEEKILAAKEKFTGILEQIPPIYSSVKVEGRRAYSYARAGESLVIKARTVTIYNFEITEITLPHIHFKVSCSKGTYIRSLAHDLGKYLGCGGYLSALRRTRVGHFNIDNAISIESFLKEIKPQE